MREKKNKGKKRIGFVLLVLAAYWYAWTEPVGEGIGRQFDIETGCMFFILITFIYAFFCFLNRLFSR